MCAVVNDLLTEKLRPKKLDQCILKNSVRTYIKNITAGDTLKNNILFYGNAGTGKTTLSRILSNPYQTLELNCSQVGIDVVRNDIENFSSQSSLFDKKERIKVVMLEECDGFTPDAWNAFRNTFEKYTKTVRFIANCNNINKIPEPIRSRFTCISLEPNNQTEKEEIVKSSMIRIGKILDVFKIKYTEDALKKFVLLYFPDLRTTLNEVGKLYEFGFKELNEETLTETFSYENLYNIILGNDSPIEIHKNIRDNYDDVDTAVIQIGLKFPEYLRMKRPDLISKIPYILINTAEYMHALPTSLNKKITLEALVFKLQQTIAS